MAKSTKKDHRKSPPAGVTKGARIRKCGGKIKHK